MIDPADSLVYGHLWATGETRELLGDRGRTRSWLRIIGELATAQGELGLIPEAAAPDEEDALLEQLVADRRVVVRLKVDRLYGSALDIDG